MKLIAQGAEAKLYKDKDVLIKERIQKSYRISEIDNKLRKSRTRREAKILKKLQELHFSSPELIKTDEKENITMQYVQGEKLSAILEKQDYLSLMKEIAQKVSILHNNEIIHGDLTTSNILLEKEIVIIDFGLSFFSKRVEDKAVDLHLFRQALESKHHTIWEECFSTFLQEYKGKAKESKEILDRFEQVENRGRNKKKSS